MIESAKILPGKVLVKPITEEKKTSSGIIIPTEIIKPKTYAAEVIMVGDDLPNMKMVVKPKDKILHSPHAFVNLVVDDVELRLLNQTDVLLIW